MPVRSGLIIPIELPEPLAAIRARNESMAGLPPHVTILFPFIPMGSLDPSVGAALAELAVASRSFRARFDKVQRQDGMIWLLPRQQEPFLELTAATVRRWPSYPPYLGAFDKLIPHLTLVESGTAAVARATSAALQNAAFEVSVEELQLIGETDSGVWCELGRYRLGP